MDCTEHTSTCSQHEVQGYPTFKYFNYGKNDQKYTGGREVWVLLLLDDKIGLCDPKAGHFGSSMVTFWAYQPIFEGLKAKIHEAFQYHVNLKGFNILLSTVFSLIEGRGAKAGIRGASIFPAKAQNFKINMLDYRKSCSTN